MSAPHTNIEKQKHKHRGPIRGIKAVVDMTLIALLFFLGYLAYNSNTDTPSQSPAIEID